MEQIEENTKIKIDVTYGRNDNYQFIMPDQKTINKVIFATHFIAFVKQSVKGPIMAIYKFYTLNGYNIQQICDVIRDGNFVFENNILYLNNCWTNYHKKNDSYIIEKVNLLKTYGEYIHESCLFNCLWDFSQTILFYVLARLDLDELRDEEFLSISVDNIMDAVFSYHVDNIIKIDFKCNMQCNIYKYKDGDNFIKFIKKK